jgi:8-oxo-dGTP diphosphatase
MAGEDLQEAAFRELMEETGLRAARMGYLFDFTGVRTCHHVFAAQIDGGQSPVPSNEITRCSWVKVTDVNNFTTSISTKGIVDILGMSTRLPSQALTGYQRAETFVRNLRAGSQDSIFCR